MIYNRFFAPAGKEETFPKVEIKNKTNKVLTIGISPRPSVAGARQVGGYIPIHYFLIYITAAGLNPRAGSGEGDPSELWANTIHHRDMIWARADT